MIPKKPGQVNVYFMISIALFVSLSVYLLYFMINYYPSKYDSIRLNSLQSKAYVISELLVKDGGYPPEWSESDVLRLGIASDFYELNQTKISRLESLCEQFNEEKRRRLFNATGLEDQELEIDIYYMNLTPVLECRPTGNTSMEAEYLKKRVAEIKRIATLEGEIVEVIVYVG
ncbi:MAG: hypothetical protein ACP5E4_03995 [Candidatus Aenigmatarchaeota archaeon]